jgi:hypothetical protein
MESKGQHRRELSVPTGTVTPGSSDPKNERDITLN